MTREQAIKLLTNKKVFVKNKSREIQEKLFSLGIYWNNNTKEIIHEDAPFLYIGNDKVVSTITSGSKVDYFYNQEYDEITPEDILNITIEPTYRPFKDAAECWEEMLNHVPFGWITLKTGNHPESKAFIIKLTENCFYFIGDGNCVTHNLYDYQFNKHFWSFVDGTPFGIKEN